MNKMYIEMYVWDNKKKYSICFEKYKGKHMPRATIYFLFGAHGSK